MVPSHDRQNVYERLVPHVLNLRKVYLKSKPEITPTPQFAELLCYTGTFMYEAGLRNNGIMVLSTAENVCDALAKEAAKQPSGQMQHLERQYMIPPEGFEDTLVAGSFAALQANVIAYLAAIHWVMGSIVDRSEAHDQARRIRDLRHKHIEGSDPNEVTFSDRSLLANSYSDLGLSLCNVEDYDSAESALMTSLQLKSECESDGYLPSFEFAATNTPLAWVRMSQGRIQDAIELAKASA